MIDKEYAGSRCHNERHLHGLCAAQWHVGQRCHVAAATDDDLEGCFHGRLVQTGENLTGRRRFHLSHRQPSVDQLIGS